jgi:hypothetical protein
MVGRQNLLKNLYLTLSPTALLPPPPPTYPTALGQTGPRKKDIGRTRRFSCSQLGRIRPRAVVVPPSPPKYVKYVISTSGSVTII